MSNEMIIVLIASGTSLLVAVVGLVTSLATNRQSTRSEKSIEAMKFEFSRILSRDEIADAQFSSAVEALQLSIQAIQHVKDEILLILSAISSSLDTKSAIEHLVDSRKKLFARHEEFMAILNTEEEKLLHQAKNVSLAVEQVVLEGIQNEIYVSALPQESKQMLLTLRNELSELQHLLRDSRSDRVLQRIK
jgi:sulfur transfer complex TusBCD TusB component (DsrH family)